ncbi:hypothetical protein [Nocardia cyriacigeorgica]|uniref:hypothetical protein n=1 Tax=Nocardia cyriacigeorgica TaxID=135487 RepID=UPI0024553B3C|nr:hypothetical protein [Nocardia cyriacigeorgica]
MPEDEQPIAPPIEGFTSTDARLADVIDRLTQLLYARGGIDPALAPLSQRPNYPHVELREQIRRAQGVGWLEQQLLPGRG